MNQPKLTMSPRNLLDSWYQEEELLVLGMFEEKTLSPHASKILHKVYNHFPGLKEDFKGKSGQKILVCLPKRGFEIKRILLYGLGKEEEFGLEEHREAMAQLVNYIKEQGIKRFNLEIFKDSSDDLRVRATVEGIGLGLYQFQNYKRIPEDAREIESIILLVRPSKKVTRAFKQGQVLVENVCFARDLVNEPANVMTPAQLQLKAVEVADDSQGKIQVEIFDKKRLTTLGMNLILAVGKGSEEEPRLIKMEYRPENAQNSRAPYVLVGKAVCFDSGGLCIKPYSSMKDMKADMAGGAAVIGTLKAISDLNLPLWVVGLVPAVENMPSGSSFKTGDIIKAYNGKTIEIGHTDAEGRLILFDALAYAKEQYNPCLIIDIATLTGACIVALGHHFAGVMGNSPEFIEKLKIAGNQSGDRVWELPLDKKFSKDTESKIADLNNNGPRWGGAINAAWFLQEAVGKDQPWIHIDCAGPVLLDSGPTSFGVRLLVQFFLNQ